MSNTPTVKRTEEEMRAEQEKKNFQDFVYQTNTWLQNITVVVNDLKKEFARHVGDVGSKLVSQDIVISGISERCQDDYLVCQELLDQGRLGLEKALHDIKNIVIEAHMKYVPAELFSGKIPVMELRLGDCESELVRLEALVKYECARNEDRSNIEVQKVKEEILSVPSEVPEIKQAFKEQVDRFRLEFDGVKEEMKALTWRTFKNEKHIEDLYMKLEKLKEG